MGLSENIFKALQLSEPSAPLYYRVTILGGAGVYVEGVSKILQLNEEKIILLVKNKKWLSVSWLTQIIKLNVASETTNIQEVEK